MSLIASSHGQQLFQHGIASKQVQVPKTNMLLARMFYTLEFIFIATSHKHCFFTITCVQTQLFYSDSETPQLLRMFRKSMDPTPQWRRSFQIREIPFSNKAYSVFPSRDEGWNTIVFKCYSSAWHELSSSLRRLHHEKRRNWFKQLKR